jgi:aquaporin Z
LFQGTWALDQLWMFWLVPLIGGIVGGLIYRFLLESREVAPRREGVDGRVPV